MRTYALTVLMGILLQLTLLNGSAGAATIFYDDFDGSASTAPGRS